MTSVLHRIALALAALLFLTAEAAAQAPGARPGGPGGPGGPQRGARPEAASPDAPPAAARAAIPWVDVHTHLVGGGQRLGAQDYDAAAAAIIKAMDEANVRASFVMPTPQPAGGAGNYDQDAFLSAIKPYRGRLFAMGGGGSIGPMILAQPDAGEVDDARRERFVTMAKAILDAGAIGFGEMTVTHLSHLEQHSYHRARPDHPLFLLLADIAAQRDVPIDLHMDPVIEPGPAPAHMKSSRNPATLVPNLAQFEVLLAHNRAARIVWAHAGWDQTEHWTADLARRLLAAHANLYMSLKVQPRSPLRNQALGRDGQIAPEWKQLMVDFPDRFVMGTDRFYAGENAAGGTAAGAVFAERTPSLTVGARILLNQLPPDLARKVAISNVEKIYKVKID